MKIRPVSPSRLDTWVCGYAGYRQYLDPERPQKKAESLPQARGSAVHEVLAKITEEICRNPKPVFTDEGIRKMVADAILMHPAAAEETKEILAMARKYIMNPPNPLTKDAQVEVALAVKFNENGWVECPYDDPEAFARGRADIMMISEDLTHALIYDHKTQPNIEDADTFQLGFYAWVIFQTHPFLQEIHTVLHFAKYGRYSQPYVWKRDELADIEDEILTRVMVAESMSDFSPTPNKHCQYCPFILECPAMSEYLEHDADGRLRSKQTSIKIMGDTNKAVNVAGAITVLEEMIGRMKKELRAHVEFTGAPIAVPGVRYGFTIKENVIDWDHANKHQRAAIYAVFEKYKVDPRHFMGFSQTFSGKIWQAENPKLSAELNAVLRRETKSEFRSSKV